MDISILLLLLLFMNNGNNGGRENNDNREETMREQRRREENEEFDCEVREEFRRLGLGDAAFTTPFNACQRQKCDLEVLIVLLLFLLFREMNAPIAAVPIPVRAEDEERERTSPFFERFD